MKNIYSKLLLSSLLLLVVSQPVFARECIECKKSNASAKKAAVQTKAAVCKRAQSTAELNINNVRALINGYGNMWYDGSVAQYHLPKNSNTCPLFCAALWIGGTDVNDQLRIAALRFGSDGDDYWPGPLKINGTASVDLPICNAYDKHWIITKAEVLAHRAHFEYGENHQVTAVDAGFDIPDVIANWPAMGQEDGLSRYLAPFYDADNDGEYNPQAGDYPYYDFDNELCPRTLKAAHPNSNYVPEETMETQYYDSSVIRGGILHDQVLKGDQTIWWIFNDKGNTHLESKGEAIGLEIRAQAFAFSTNDEINNMTFYSYEIINRSSYELKQTYFSQWVDPDLGYAFDDYVGCDVRRGLGYCYNGLPQDTPGSASYSGVPPAVGIDFFQGPYMDPDQLDNPKIDIDKIRSDSYINETVKKLLETYRRDTIIGGVNVVRYDTIAITDDADLFLAYDHNSWYFKPGDTVGNCAINGVNFGNNIIDDERFGMRRFVYYDNQVQPVYGEPEKASDYYNYLRGYWKNGQRMKYAGNAVSTGTTELDCDFMFPDNSDPWHWGTNGEIPEINPNDWRETTAGNPPGDRRFMQSAGPFTLKPGAINYITVGIPFAQASNGDDQWASVVQLRQIDDVCQALFENCFKVLDGPDAPTITAQELDGEVILYLSYDDKTSNNYNEKYREMDPGIPRSYTGEDGQPHFYDTVARSYIFEGYQIYQLRDAKASIADINDISKARLVAQCDIENYYDTLLITSTLTINDDGDTVAIYDTTVNPNPTLKIDKLVNYTTNSATGLMTPQIMVEGANKGIQHVFRITSDLFATSQNTALVNNREYYYVAIAYAQNRYKAFSQTDAASLDGQKTPYLAGRKNERGRSIEPITVIPHNPMFEDGGKQAQAEFGMSPRVIRLEGYGNGTSTGLRLSDESISELMGAPGVEGKQPGTYVFNYSTGGVGRPAGDYSYMNNPCILAHPQYNENSGPLNVRVIDPLKLREGRYNILLWNITHDAQGNITNFNNDTVKGGVNKNTRWCVVNADGGPVYDDVDTVWSHFNISRYNEQIFPDLGIAVTLVNPKPAASSIDISTWLDRSGNPTGVNNYTGKFYQGFVNEGALIGSSMTFSDNNKMWLDGLRDNDSYFVYNWIRSGSQFSANSYKNFISPTTKYNINESYLDEDYFKAFKTSAATNDFIDSSEGIDKTQIYEGVLGGLWGPYGVVSTMPFHPGFSFAPFITDDDHILDSLGVNRNQLERILMTNIYNKALNYNELAKLPSVHIVITADQSKWTRCPVVEMCDDYTQSEGNARRFMMRRHASVNKDGKTKAELDAEGTSYTAGSSDDPEYISANGMGWFPGYAVNSVTGERLNIMFGEDSRYVQYNGRDMLWNPVTVAMEGSQNYVMGGRHFIYVFNASRQTFYDILDGSDNSKRYTTFVTPSYDAGRWAAQMLSSAERLMQSPFYPARGTKLVYKGLVNRADNYAPQRDSIAMLYASVAWVNMPMLSNDRYAFDNPVDIPCDVTIDIDIRTPYSKYMSPNGTDADRTGYSPINRNMPAYQFVISSDDAVIENIATATDARKTYIDSLLSFINVVPNPYYSYSNYETLSQLETKVRIINLPTGTDANGKKKGCTINIYTVDGTLVRTIGPVPVNQTTVDWDLLNHNGLSISGGMYLIHVTVPGIGERVIKWFGSMRPVDLNAFQF